MFSYGHGAEIYNIGGHLSAIRDYIEEAVAEHQQYKDTYLELVRHSNRLTIHAGVEGLEIKVLVRPAEEQRIYFELYVDKYRIYSFEEIVEDLQTHTINNAYRDWAVDRKEFIETKVKWVKEIKATDK